MTEGKSSLNEPILYIYVDVQRFGNSVSLLTESFHKHPLEIDLTQACVVELNTILRNEINWPIVYGVGVNIRTGEIFPATFPDKGPEVALRLARSFTGSQTVIDIYDSNLGMLRIGPFNYDPLRGVDLWLAQNDEFLLQHLSTSPEVEPPSFVMQVITLETFCGKRNRIRFAYYIKYTPAVSYSYFSNFQLRSALKYIQDNQFPAVTVFPDNRPHFYRRDENTGCWQLVRY